MRDSPEDLALQSLLLQVVAALRVRLPSAPGLLRRSFRLSLLRLFLPSRPRSGNSGKFSWRQCWRSQAGDNGDAGGFTLNDSTTQRLLTADAQHDRGLRACDFAEHF